MENYFTYDELEVICDLIAAAGVEEEKKTGEPSEYKKLLKKVVWYQMEIRERIKYGN